MELSFPIQCLLIGLLGTVAAVLGALKSLQAKASAASLDFKIGRDYFQKDWYTIAISLVAITMGYIALPYYPKTLNPLWGILGFFLLGYAGNDVIFKLYSFANSRLNKAIDAKTTIADESMGILGTKTPIDTKPQS